MTFDQKELYKNIDDILWKEWDPLGINDIEEADDEYKGYTPQIFSLKVQGSDSEIIAKKLFEIATNEMGVVGNIDHCRQVASRISNLK
ncbi:MAG: hypothetical protein K0S44_1527 [Bacteroidetes bacterium]|jgi:predicted choloylglycine hydrolase|nr:hypothetical protein [Bacteroidota bacterium]